jgi:rhodanese-related sulfurtransferase
MDPAFESKVSTLLSFSVQTLTVKEVQDSIGQYLLLDARESKEWEISRIPGAQYIGYKDPNWSILDNVSPDTPILLYCSVGYRSEKIGEILQERGFSNVHNLYGSIFEWVNQGNPVIDSKGELTDTVHTYNRRWSRWLNKEKAVRIW